jgi:hypothetical protein
MILRCIALLAASPRRMDGDAAEAAYQGHGCQPPTAGFFVDSTTEFFSWHTASGDPSYTIYRILKALLYCVKSNFNLQRLTPHEHVCCSLQSRM